VADEGSIQVQGAELLQSTLRDASDQLADMAAANVAIGNMVVNEARSLAPKRSGQLAGSVSATVGVGVIDVGADTPYAGPIHWGWPAHNIAAQPFIQEAIENTEEQSVQIYEDELNRVLSTVKGDDV
jgi:phage gpG-like protein